MESLDLRTLTNTLPKAALAGAEIDLLDDFKAAAQSITTLYRSSRATSKRAYTAGYAAACTDILAVVQRGVSNGTDMRRVLDWIEARIEAVRSREEEEEEEEREQRPKNQNVNIARTATPPTSASERPQIVQATRTPPVPASSPGPASHSSPSPPPTALRPIQAPNGSNQQTVTPSTSSRPVKLRANVPPNTVVLPTPMFTLDNHTVAITPESIVAGTKRRHATMLTDMTPVVNVSRSGSKRNRHRGSKRGRESEWDRDRERGEAMDIEAEDGRERKRVARR